MILDIEEDRLFVVSDLHLGNPASLASRRILPFLQHVADEGGSLCINGDGFDMLQTSFKRLAGAAVPVLAQLQTIAEQRRAGSTTSSGTTTSCSSTSSTASSPSASARS